MQRPVSTLSLSSGLKVKLVSAGLQVCGDLVHLEPRQLRREAGLSEQEAQEVLQATGGAVAAWSSSTALELLQKEDETRSVVTFCSRLDAALGGGVPLGRLTEVCGVPGIGKTQLWSGTRPPAPKDPLRVTSPSRDLCLLSLQLAVDVQVPQCFGGVGGQAVYVDTEGGFLSQRVADVASAAVAHCSLLAEDEEQRVAVATFTVDAILSNIFLVRCHDDVELLAQLHLLPDFLSEHPRVRLLIIDGVAFPFKRFDDLSQRTRLLLDLAQRLVAMATRHHSAVVVTNQMTTRLRGGDSRLVPALGESWGHAPAVRLLLRWAGSRRLATVVKSPAQVDASVPYGISCDGFRDQQ